MRLCGNERATSHRRICSASIRTITSPRNASNEISRVVPSVLRSGSAPGASDTGLSSCALSIIKGSYDQLRTDAKVFSFSFSPGSVGELHSSLKCKARRVRTNVPLAARKIGEFLGRAILCYRSFTKRSRRTPFGGIVDIDIGHQPPLQAIHQPVIHNVVHSAVATHLACQFSGGFPERMLILVAKGIAIPPIFFLLSVQENTWRVIGEYALCGRDRVEAAVGLWGGIG